MRVFKQWYLVFITIVVCCQGIVHNSMGVIKEMAIQGGSAFFTGRVDTAEFKGDSIRVLFNKDFITNGSKWEWRLTESEWFYVKPAADGYFQFSIKELNHPGRIDIGLVNGSRGETIGRFIVEPGDEVNINVQSVSGNPQASFSGRSSSKFMCQVILAGLWRQTVKKDTLAAIISQLGKEFTFEQLGRLKGVYKSVIDQSNDVVRMYTNRDKGAVGYNLINANSTSEIKLKFLSILFGFYLDSSLPASAKAIIRSFWATNSFELGEIDSSLIAYSPVSVEYLFRKGVCDFYYLNERKPSIRDLYTFFKHHYSGVLREKLMSKLLIELDPNLPIDRQELDINECVSDAQTIIKTKSIRQAFSEQSVFFKGREAFDFSLFTLDNELCRLQDLRGKVVLIDLWFVGCTGCAQFHELFRDSVYNILLNREEFVHVSICCNSNREIWTKGVQSGKYTDLTHVNLSFEKLGYDHPFIKYYNVQRYPFLLVVGKDGRVFGRIYDFSKVRDVANLINSALQEN